MLLQNFYGNTDGARVLEHIYFRSSSTALPGRKYLKHFQFLALITFNNNLKLNYVIEFYELWLTVFRCWLNKLKSFEFCLYYMILINLILQKFTMNKIRNSIHNTFMYLCEVNRYFTDFI